MILNILEIGLTGVASNVLGNEIPQSPRCCVQLGVRQSDPGNEFEWTFLPKLRQSRNGALQIRPGYVIITIV